MEWLCVMQRVVCLFPRLNTCAIVSADSFATGSTDWGCAAIGRNADTVSGVLATETAAGISSLRRITIGHTGDIAVSTVAKGLGFTVPAIRIAFNCVLELRTGGSGPLPLSQSWHSGMRSVRVAEY